MTVFFALCFTVSAVNIISILYSSYCAEKMYDEVAFSAVVLSSDETVPAAPNAEAFPISVDFDSLASVSDEIVGWLYSPKTPINYPVMQTSNNQKYLSRLPDGSDNKAGSIFADCRNGAFGSDSNYIIYGHNMKNDAMFGTLTEYRLQSYYDAHPVLYYSTPAGNYEIEAAAGFVCDAESDIYRINQSSEHMSDFMVYAKSQSDFVSRAEYTAGDKTVTLSTCLTGNSDDTRRYVLIGIVKEITD